jgi:DNA (cytosine-5)-methyltransferase 1
VRVLDLFSGIGGFSLGLERAGMRTVAFCERDEFCRAVLAKHWPGLPCFEDIHDLDADRLGGLGSIDLVCGGFPCQPFSVAGKQKAQEDDRHLWPAMREVIALARPTWVIGENVAGIVALALDDVLADLEGLGYATRTFVIPACAVGAHHRRDRVWIVANAVGDELRDESGRRRGAGGQGATEPGDDGAQGPVADASGHGLQGQCDRRDPGETPFHGPRGTIAGTGSAADAHTTSVLRAAFIRNESNGAHDPTRCAWLPESDVGRVADGVPRRVDRLRTLGNAVVPQVVYELGRAIMSNC